MTQKYNEQGNKDLDKGWAWVVMIAACLAGVLNGLLIYGAGIMHVALLQSFEEDNAYTSLIGAIYTSLLSLIGPLASVMINVYDCRTTMIIGGVVMFVGFSASFFVLNSLDYILLTYGLIAGTGLGLCATPPLVVIGYFFHLKRGLALAVVVSGAGIGMFISGPLIQALVNNYGLQGAFLVLAGIASNQVVIGALMKPSDLEIRHKKDLKGKHMQVTKQPKSLTNTLKELLHFDILTDKAFMLCSLQYLIWNIPFSILFLHLTNYAILQGSTADKAAILITYIGICSVIGRIITGLSLGHNGLDPIMLNFGLNCIAGLLTVFFPLYSASYQGQVIYSVLFGLYGGGLATMNNPLCMELIGVSKVSSGIGMMYFLGGVGYIMGPPIAGLIVDKGGKYEHSFVLCGALFLLAAVFTLLANNWRIESHDGQTEANEPDLEIAVEIVKRKSIVVKNEHINKSVLSLANEHAHLSLMTDEDKTGDFDVS